MHSSRILLISEEGGQQQGEGDRDGWEPEGTYLYFGEGEFGDMVFSDTNRAIRDHSLNGKELHLFTIGSDSQEVSYLGQMVCVGYELVPDVPDQAGALRTAIAFQLAPVSDVESQAEYETEDSDQLTLEELRQRATQQPAKIVEPRQALRNAYRRSVAVRKYVLRRADGRCEGCQAPAPFVTVEGRPYLEPHHTRRVSDGGPDHPAHVIALCPNCHSRVHHGADGETYNEDLKIRLQDIEGLRESE